MRNEFNENEPATATAVGAISETHIKINNSEIQFNIWDTAGILKSFERYTKHFVKDSDGLLLLFSIASKNSFEFLDSCKEFMKESSLISSNIQFYY